jgi:hypothetical protein
MFLAPIRQHAIAPNETESFYSPGPVACFSDEDDVSGNQNNCYWPLHSESIENDIYFVLNQLDQLDFYSASSLKQQFAGRQVAPLCSDTLFWFRANQSLFSLLNHVCLAQSFDFERNRWRLFQKCGVRTKFHIYVFILKRTSKQGGQRTSYIRVFFFIMAEIFQQSDKIKLIFILF